jgi:phage gp29-like protein
MTPPASNIIPVPTSVSAGSRVAALNRWRDSNNPLRSLTFDLAINRLERAQAGVFADIQWTYEVIERRDADLMCCIESTISAIAEMNWYIRTCEGDPRRAAQWDNTLAQEQSAALLEYWNRILNVGEGIEHLAMANFRGYSHVQIRADGQFLETWNPLPHWNVARAGYSGSWYWNPDARQISAETLGKENLIDPANYIILATRRPIDELGLIKFLRMSLSEKDWDAFIEIYGIPSWMIIMPPNVPPDKYEEYRDAAEDLAEKASGALPNGADAKAAGYPNGTAPFKEHLEWWSQRLVMAATGGLLTSLALPTGIGSGATDAHTETFERIARARALRISEECQRKIDTRILNQLFPGKPRLAYWCLDTREEQDAGKTIDQIVALSGAFDLDPQQVEEKTGFRVTRKVQPAQPSQYGQPGQVTPPQSPMSSRADVAAAVADTGDGVAAQLRQTGARAYAAALQQDMAPLIDRLLPILDIQDPPRMYAELKKVFDDYPSLAKQVLSADATTSALEQIESSAIVNGWAEGAATRRMPQESSKGQGSTKTAGAGQ